MSKRINRTVPFISVVIPSAGSGKRMGFKKQYHLLNKKPILAWTISIFQDSPLISEIVLAVPKNDIMFCKTDIVTKYKFNKVKKIVAGGKTRQVSVFNGLKVCNPDSRYILIHDAVRPFFDKKLLPKLIQQVKKYKAVVTAVPARDTIKVVHNGLIAQTITHIFHAQTPQAFSANLVKEAYRKAEKDGWTGTDDSSLVERTGVNVRIFIGNEENIKITTANDLKPNRVGNLIDIP